MAYNEVQKRAVAKYNSKSYDEIKLRVKKGNKQIIETAAKEKGKSLNSYVVEAVEKQLIESGNPSILNTKEGE